MAQCPNCKQKLRLTDISQNCPHCGVNMRFFGYDTRFYHDAKEAELSNARVHVFVRTMKAALVGSRLAQLRLAAAFLPAISLLAPIARASVNFPFMQARADLGILGAVWAVKDGIINSYPALLGTATERSVVMPFTVAAGGFLLAALAAVGILLTTLLSFCSVRRSARANCVFGVLGTAAVLIAVVLSAVTGASANVPGWVIDCAVSFGWAIQIPVFLLVFAVNLAVLKKGLPPELDEGMAQRIEIAQKVRSGEVKLDDLPQPIVETETTRKIRAEIEKARAQYREKLQELEAAADEKA